MITLLVSLGVGCGFLGLTVLFQIWRRKARVTLLNNLELRPNCLISRHPLVFVSGRSSLFRLFDHWNLIPGFLREHGYEILILEPMPLVGYLLDSAASLIAALDDLPEQSHLIATACSRREIEEWIAAGRVSVNSKPAHVGQRIGPRDLVRVNGKQARLKFAPRAPRILLYHKLEGEIVSRNDPQKRPTVFDRLPRVGGGRWIAVGRLDFNSSGLLLFTASGELANRLMHPSFNIEREYAVRIMGELSPEQRRALLDGVELEDGMAHFNTLSEEGGEGSNRWYRVTLNEGRNREVRRMFETLGLMVSRLIRVRYGPVILPPRLKRGAAMELEEEEVKKLLDLLKPQTIVPEEVAEGVPAGRKKPVKSAKEFARRH